IATNLLKELEIDPKNEFLRTSIISFLTSRFNTKEEKKTNNGNKMKDFFYLLEQNFKTEKDLNKIK
ncbi:MAG: hypothetical protein ACPG41_08190, partial [Lacinutrix venerupis]